MWPTHLLAWILHDFPLPMLVNLSEGKSDDLEKFDLAYEMS